MESNNKFKMLTFHNVIILIKSVFSKDKNTYYYNILLRKGSYELPNVPTNSYIKIISF